MGPGSETGDASGPRRAARRPGFMGEIADGIAGAVLSAPELAAAALLASTLWLSASTLCICVAHMAGVALGRVSARRRLVILSGWLALAAAEWATRNDLPPVPRLLADWRPVQLVLSLLAVAWAARRRDVWIVAGVVVAAALALRSPFDTDPGTVTVSSVGGPTPRTILFIQAGFSAAVLVLVALGRRGWKTAGIVVVAVIVLAELGLAGAWGGGLGGAFILLSAVSMVCGFVALLVPVVCGMAARAAALGAAPDDGARFAIAVARWPWTAALTFGVLVLASPNSFQTMLSAGGDPAAALALLGLIASASALMAMTASGAAGSLGALAPLCAASTLALCAWFMGSLFGGTGDPFELTAHRALRSAAYLVPQVLARAALVPVLGLWRFTMALVAIAVILPPAALSAGVDASPWTGLAWVLVVTTTCVALSASERPAALIVAGAVVLGLVQRLAMELVPAGRHSQLGTPSWFEVPTVWMLAAVFVLIARRARTMTAVPLDHPMFVDFAPAAG